MENADNQTSNADRRRSDRKRSSPTASRYAPLQCATSAGSPSESIARDDPSIKTARATKRTTSPSISTLPTTRESVSIDNTRSTLREQGRTAPLEVTPTASSSTMKDSSGSDIVLELSNRCTNHQHQMHPSCASDPLPRYSEPLPDSCQNILTHIQGFIQTMEQRIVQITSGDASSTSPVVALRQFCKLYHATLNRTFCPYTPHLFCPPSPPEGQHPTSNHEVAQKMARNVLPRAHYLVQQLVSHETLLRACTVRTEDDSTILDDVSSTVAYLLTWIPDLPVSPDSSGPKSSVLSDFVTTLLDLCALIQSLQEDPSLDCVEMVFLPETSRLAGLEEELVLEISLGGERNDASDLEGPKLMLAVMMGALNRWLEKRKLQFLESWNDVFLVAETKQGKGDGNGDRKSGFYFDGLDSELQDNLMASLRFVLLHMAKPIPSAETAVSSGNVKLQKRLRQRHSGLVRIGGQAKLFASQLLHKLETDWLRGSSLAGPGGGGPVLTMSTALESALLIVRAVNGALREELFSADNLTQTTEEYHKTLGQLMQTFLVDQWSQQGLSCVTVDAIKQIRYAVALDLLDGAVKFMVLRRTSSDRGSVRSIAGNLEAIVLRFLHLTLRDSVSVLKMNSFLQTCSGSILGLVELLDDPLLSTGAMCVLSLLIPLDRWDNIEKLAQDFASYSIDDKQVGKTQTGRVGHQDAFNKRRSQRNDNESISRKRQRKDGNETVESRMPGSDSTSTQLPCAALDASVARFLVSAHRACVSLGKNDVGGGTVTPAMKSHALSLSSSIRFLVLIASQTPTFSLPQGIRNLLQTLCQRMIDLYTKSESYVDNSEASSWFSFAIDCGAVVHAVLECSEFKDDLVGFVSELSVLVQKANLLYLRTFAENGACLPDRLISTDVAAHLLVAVSGQAHSHGPPFSLSLLPSVSGCWAPNEIGFQEKIDFIHCSLTGDVELQKSRLSLLQTFVGGGSTARDCPDETVSAWTVRVVLSILPNLENRLVRFLGWQCLSWLFISPSPDEVRDCVYALPNNSTDEVQSTRTASLVDLLLRVTFTDAESYARSFAANECGKLFTSKGFDMLCALRAKRDDWNIIMQCRTCPEDATVEEYSKYHALVEHFLGMVAVFIPERNPSSGYSASVASTRSSHAVTRGIEDQVDTPLTVFASAVRGLTSICAAQNITETLERALFERTLIFVLGFSAYTSPACLERSSLCFGELSCLGLKMDFGRVVRQHCSVAVVPSLLRSSVNINGLGQTSMDADKTRLRERQYLFVSRIIGRFFLKGRHSLRIPGDSNFVRIMDFLIDFLPDVTARFLANSDVSSLTMTMELQHYMRTLARVHDKACERKQRRLAYDGPVDMITGNRRRVLRPKRLVGSSLEDVKNLVLCSQYFTAILPVLFARASRKEYLFFQNEIVRDNRFLLECLKDQDQPILKGIIWELAEFPISGNDTQVSEALQFALSCRSSLNRSAPASAPGLNDGPKIHKSGSEDAVEWVTSNFFYLIVSMIQMPWASRSIVDRARSLRCLEIILRFLRPSEAAQYFSPIMATVNMAITESMKSGNGVEESLRFVAVKSLSAFVKLVVSSQWEVVGKNLIPIVVSLIPVLSTAAVTPPNGDDQVSDYTRSKQLAVTLLLDLTDGDVGVKLAPFFSTVPFLASEPALQIVRESLSARGVDFNGLQMESSQKSQTDESTRESLTSDFSFSIDDRGPSLRPQVALRKRLGIICSLLDDENVEVRRVTLRHLADLLRSNRQTFHILVENEQSTLMTRFITKSFNRSRGAVTALVEVLLGRCVKENDTETRELLAVCLGEVGAIDSNRLTGPQVQDAGSVVEHQAWIRSNPPWHSTKTRYELQLVTKHLVACLRAAPSSTDLNKIALCIQELLEMLNNASTDEDHKSAPISKGRWNETETDAKKMKPWLVEKLEQANVFSTVEPFWNSEFKEKAHQSVSQPPFFVKSKTYFEWLSTWSKFMINNAQKGPRGSWGDLFHACRTAVRTHAGTRVMEFLLPILVLDRLVFGDTTDEQALVSEMTSALALDSSTAPNMNHTERQRAVNTVFTVLDTLQLWADEETEGRHKKEEAPDANKDKGNDQDPAKAQEETGWSAETSILRIGDMFENLPLSMRARAAAKVGMNARALRFLELASRKVVVGYLFNHNSGDDGIQPMAHSSDFRRRSRASGQCPPSEFTLMKDVLAALYDYETMASLEEHSFNSEPIARAIGSIRLKEAAGDWEGALQDYERTLQLGKDDLSLQRGSLRCLLELGQLDSVLNQVHGIAAARQRCSSDIANIRSLGTEAAWRLGRWDELSNLAGGHDTTDHNSPETDYQLSHGRIMLGLKEKDQPVVVRELSRARRALMVELSNSARESYSRAYDQIVRLQTLREIEEALPLLIKPNPEAVGKSLSCLQWERRLSLMTQSGAGTAIKTRLGIARLSGDKKYEGELFLKLGTQARKRGLLNIAANSFAQSEVAFLSVPRVAEMGHLQIQVAKLRHQAGDSGAALKMLDTDSIEDFVDLSDEDLKRRVMSCSFGINDLTVKDFGSNHIDTFVKRALQSTRWMVDGGLKDKSDIRSRFRVIHRLAPKWGKGHFQYATYVDGLLAMRISSLQRRSQNQSCNGDEFVLRSRAIASDKTCQRHLQLAMKHYIEDLSLEMNHVYQSLPRLLSLWFEFLSVNRSSNQDRSLRETVDQRDKDVLLSNSQQGANELMARNLKRIPPRAFYTAIPQLISNVLHSDSETGLLVRNILVRLLVKFPLQAMWPICWLRQSKDRKRKTCGEMIFKEALTKLENRPPRRVLQSSKSLINYFQKVAKHPGPKGRTIRVEPWSGEVDLVEFIPPIQAAISISLETGDSCGNRDFFPRQVPRMRAFDKNMYVFRSKASPKKVKAFAVSADYGLSTKSADIGEIHLLVKQEIKGDLRKDARMQELNNVVNRLLSSSNSSASVSRRRLSVRTYAVTCMSEESGILEWVQDTDSLRSLIRKSYNQLASPFSAKRRGTYGTTLDNPRQNKLFQMVHKTFYEDCDLKNAARLFESTMLEAHPPVLYWWFVQKFLDPHAWYDARTKFTTSVAAWSAIGHVIGLGDRHTENILVDTSNGECVHVDFDCIFDKGLTLPIPEIVPFRLTQNMVDAFGPTGADGVYSHSLHNAMSTLRNHRATLLSVLEPFINDPVIDWKRHRTQQSQDTTSTSSRSQQAAKRSIKVCAERLEGIYNLRNPNLAKIAKTQKKLLQSGRSKVDHTISGTENDSEDDDDIIGTPLSVEGQVHKMISEATSTENLLQQFIGWMPWV